MGQSGRGVRAVVAGVELHLNSDGNDKSLWRIDWMGGCGDGGGAMVAAMPSPSMIVEENRGGGRSSWCRCCCCCSDLVACGVMRCSLAATVKSKGRIDSGDDCDVRG